MSAGSKFIRYSIILAALFALSAYLVNGPERISREWQDWVLLDELRDHINARALLEEGRLPRHGSVASFFALNPPGIAYAHVIGLLVRPDNPLQAVQFGALAVNLITMMGLALILQRTLPIWAVLLGILTYALSDIGLFYSYWLWPRGHGCFLVWFIWGALRWVIDGKPSGLGVSLLACTLGMYWFLEIAPLIAVIPVLWMIGHPPVKGRQVVGVAIISLAVWSPYLKHQFERSLIDLRVLLVDQTSPYDFDDLRRSALDKVEIQTLSKRPKNWKVDWQQVADDESKPCKSSHVANFGWICSDYRPVEFRGVRGFNFYFLEQGNAFGFQGTDGHLFILRENGWEAQSTEGFLVPELAQLEPISVPADQPIWIRFWNHIILSNVPDSERILPVHLFAILMIATPILIIMNRVRNRRRRIGADQKAERGFQLNEIQVVLLCVAIPFLILAFLSSPISEWHDYKRRLYWLWPGQIAFAILAWKVFQQVHRFAGWIYFAFLITVCSLIISPHFFNIKPVLEDPTPTATVLEELRKILSAEGRDSAWIGYDIHFNPWILAAHQLDPNYKVGAELDLLLRYGYGIENRDVCAEGISDRDEFRIVQKHQLPGTESIVSNNFNLAEYPRMEVVKEWNTFALLRRPKKE